MKGDQVMSRKLNVFALALMSATAVSLAARGVPLAAGDDKADPHSKVVQLTPTTIKWAEGPPSLPPGAKFAIFYGDLTKAEPFTIRLKLPDGYQVPPHWYPLDEGLTVIRGTLMMGTGDKFDKTAAFELPA